jgi:hypothetical protein
MCTDRSANHTHAPKTARAAASTLRFDLFGATLGSRPAVSDALRPPALRVNHNKFEIADGEWAPLLNPSAVRGRIAPNLLAVGRIHQERVTLGTGFLVSNDVVLTNRHVAESFTTNINGTRKIRPGWEPAIDFLAHLPPPEDATAHDADAHDHAGGDVATTENVSVSAAQAAQAGHAAHADDSHDSHGMHESVSVTAKEHGADGHGDEGHAAFHTGPAACFRIASVLYVDDEIDLALLRVEFEPEGETPRLSELPSFWSRPAPVTLALTEPRAARLPVYIIGCPDDDDTATPNELSTVFQDTFDVKRLQPGHLTAILMAHDDRVEIDHDCSTLRGNSGSCVVDLETHQVIGLHVRGSREGPGETAYNQAIGLWRLPEKTRLMMAAAGVMLEPVKEPLSSMRMGAGALATS